MYNILRKNHAISIYSTNRKIEKHDRSRGVYKSNIYAHWHIQIYRILPPIYWSNNCQQLIVHIGRDHLIVAIIVALRDYIQWKRKHPNENINEWED